MDKYIKYDAQPGVVLYIENKGHGKECCYDLGFKAGILGYSISEMKAHKK